MLKFAVKFCIFSLLLIFSSKAWAFEEISKNLNLIKNYSYLVSFDEKIIRYRVGNENAVKVELLTKIFENNYEILIRPVEETNTNLIVWTDFGIYNFLISSNKEAVSDNSNKTPLIISFGQKENKFRLDKPPRPVNNLKLDAPPKVK